MSLEAARSTYIWATTKKKPKANPCRAIVMIISQNG